MKKDIPPKDYILERLLLKLTDEDLRPGDKLPSERQLCEAWDVNRTTLRSALKHFQKRNLIEAVPGRGYFKRKPKFERNLQDLRSLNARAAEQGKRLTTVVIRQSVITAGEGFAKRLGLPPEAPVLELIRLRYIDDAPSLLEYSYIDLTRAPGLEQHDFAVASLYETLEQHYDLTPERGRQKVSICYLNDNEELLLQQPAGTPALYLSGRTYEQGQKRPFEVFKSIIREDQVRYSSVLTMDMQDVPDLAKGDA